METCGAKFQGCWLHHFMAIVLALGGVSGAWAAEVDPSATEQGEVTGTETEESESESKKGDSKAKGPESKDKENDNSSDESRPEDFAKDIALNVPKCIVIGAGGDLTLTPCDL
jgi:hypothetical protein